MRTLFFASFCATVAATIALGCSGGGTYHPPLHLDMGNGSGDMAGKLPDLSMNQNCQAPMQNCNGTCTDTSSDSLNCGFCGHACTNGQFCSGSSCQGGGQPDLSMISNGTANCGMDIQCINACMDQTCFMNCQAMSKASSWMILGNLITCLFSTACPDMNGGVCDSTAGNYNATNCNNCLSAAQMAGGACDAQTQACANDP